MKCKGKAWKFGADINTDVIISARYLNLSKPGELAKHCMENIHPRFAREAREGDIIVADKNFGCGSSREHAPIAIKGKGISCVIAKTFARIFYRNAFNMGLSIVESTEVVDEIEEGQEIEVDTNNGRIINLTTGVEFAASPIPAFMMEIINDGGLLKHVIKERNSND
jgi:3-isopropylmalate/(R)-2-methylmalate dehydratase small subunit